MKALLWGKNAKDDELMAMLNKLEKGTWRNEHGEMSNFMKTHLERRFFGNKRKA